MADGETRDVFYNGFTLEELRDPYGLKNLGIERVKPIFTRGVLIDLARLKGGDRLPPGYEVTLADVRAALASEGIAEASLRPGDALFFSYGLAPAYSDPSRRGGSPPGIGMEVARWIVEQRAAMIGSDAGGTEVTPNPDRDLSFPVHQELIMRNGIFNLENLTFEELLADRVYEFLFIFTPIRFRGATGSPGRPIAIR
jgi:kynurenine formamidase